MELATDEAKAALKELIQLVRQNERYWALTSYEAAVPDEVSEENHRQRLARVEELLRNFGVA